MAVLAADSQGDGDQRRDGKYGAPAQSETRKPDLWETWRLV